MDRSRTRGFAVRLVATSTVAAFLLGGALLTAGSAQADHTWGKYHWARTKNPFLVRLGDNVGTKWHESLAQASADWGKSSVLNTRVVDGSTTAKTCKATKGRVEVCTANYGSTGWLGIATISVTGSHIVQGTVRLNDTYFETSTFNTQAWRNSVMCQEIGHTFGLDHQDENYDNANLGTCMDYTNKPAGNQHPNAHDYNMLEKIYDHTDGSSTVQATGSSAVADWRTVRLGPRKGHCTYVRDLGHGRLLVRHVMWVD